MTAILGLSAYYHDSAAALVVDGRVVAAAQEERFSRIKHDASFPKGAVAFCLERAGLSASDLDYVVFYEKPLLKFDRLLETYLRFAPAGFRSFATAMPQWLGQKLHIPRDIRHALGNNLRRPIVFTDHHESHAASAFFPSPFDEAAILTLDGVGEWATATRGVGRGNRIELTHETRFPHSIGLLYSAFTYYCGFEVNGGEYKLMGLAPYGEPSYAAAILDDVMELKEDGSFHLDMTYFDYCAGLTMTSRKFHARFGGPPRRPDSPLENRHFDLARSVQHVVEECLLRAARDLHRETGMRDVCLAGGVALNCVANGRLLREGPFERVWVQPAAGDAGSALGAALFVWHQLLEQPRVANASDAQQGSWLGPDYTEEEIDGVLRGEDLRYTRHRDTSALVDDIAARLEAGEVVGWFQDRMEFGPRALGARSLLADPRRTDMQSQLNLKVKFRESFRPFAPAVLVERVAEYFGTRDGFENPYMMFVDSVRPEHRIQEKDGEALTGLARLKARRSTIPAVTHVDGSARIQTVDAERHGAYRALLEAFATRTGCGVLVNTSFNLGWEPIVCSPRDAYRTFMSSAIDTLAIGPFTVSKQDQRVEAESARGGAAAVNLPAIRPLLDAARRNAHWRAIDGSLAYNIDVLNVCCGDGSLANYLGIACRRVTGIDTRATEIERAEKSRLQYGLGRVSLRAMTVAGLDDGQVFDAIVWVDRDGQPPIERQLEQCVSRLAAGGVFVIGCRGAAAAAADRARRQSLPGHRGSGFRFSTVMKVFARAGLRVIRTVPSHVPGLPSPPDDGLFMPEPAGTRYDRMSRRLLTPLVGATINGVTLVIATRQ